MAHKRSFGLPLVILLLASFGVSSPGEASGQAPLGATSTAVVANGTPVQGVLDTAWTFTATITPSAGTPALTGTVTFYDGGTALLSAVNVSGDVATLTGVMLANNLSHSITAVYSGDANWAGSTSQPLVLPATTLNDYVVLTSNFSTVPPQESLILTATVTPVAPPPANAEQNPTGNVLFYDGTTMIGTVPLVATPLSNISTATFSTSTLPGGMDALSAYYVGDLWFDAATSNTLTLDVQNFIITPSPTNPPTNLNITQGAAGSASFNVTGLGGFDSEVQVVCSVPAQDDMTCTVTPQQIVPPGTVTFVVQTFVTGGPSGTATIRPHAPIWPRAAGGTALALLGFFLLPFRRRARIFTRRSTRRFLVLLLLLVGLGGAGIGCNSVSGVVSTGTPLGVAIFKITASAYVDNTVASQSVYLTVDVLPAS